MKSASIRASRRVPARLAMNDTEHRQACETNRAHRVCLDRFLCFARCARSAERGEDSSLEFNTLVVPIILMILLVAFASIVRAAQMPIWNAASECARQAVASQTEATGRRQATDAALASLNNNAIDPTSVEIIITGDWTPNSPINCLVNYNIDVSNIAFISELTGGFVPMSAQVTLRTEPFKSKWQ